MRIGKTINTLEIHGIHHRTESGRVLALDMFTHGGQQAAEWVDVTDWTRHDLMEWLGY